MNTYFFTVQAERRGDRIIYRGKRVAKKAKKPVRFFIVAAAILGLVSGFLMGSALSPVEPAADVLATASAEIPSDREDSFDENLVDEATPVPAETIDQTEDLPEPEAIITYPYEDYEHGVDGIPAIYDEPDSEAVNEAELIELALKNQGYFRDDVPMPYEMQDILHTACDANGIEYAVALGLIEHESRFKANAVNSKSGAYGYCQINPKYHPSDLSPAENIIYAMNYLGEKLRQYDGDIIAALTAYNAGYDTGYRTYANAVMAFAEKWR